MGAVPVTVQAVQAEDVVHVVRPAAELRLVSPDARVDDVRVHARARRGVAVRAREGKRPLIDPVEPPRVAVRIHLLGPVGLDQLIGLDVGDERVLPQGRHRRIRQTCCESLESACVDL